MAAFRPVRSDLLPMICLLALCGILYFYNLGGYSLLITPDEGRFAESTREMVEGGEWLTPLYGGEPRFDKPILFYWLTGAAFRIVGAGELAARLPSAVATTGLVLILYLLGRAVAGRMVGLLAAGLLAGSVNSLELARLGITDALLGLLSGGAILAYFWALEGDGKVAARVTAYSLGGLALLTKGPIGVAYPLMALLPFHLWGRPRRPTWERGDTLGLLALALVGLPWFLWAAITYRGQFLESFILFHHLQRLIEPMGVQQGRFFYLWAVPLYFLPGVVLLPWALSRFHDWLPRTDRSGRLWRLCVVWALVPLLFFTVAASKKIRYMFPAFPALALLVALPVGEALRGRGSARGLRGSIKGSAVFFTIPALALSAMAVFPGTVGRLVPILAHNQALRDVVTGLGPVHVLLALVIGAGVPLLLAWRSSLRVALLGLAGPLLAGILVAYGHVFPTISRHRYGDLKAFAEIASVEARPEEAVYLFALPNKTSVLFYARRPVEVVQWEERATWLSELGPRRAWVILDRARLAGLEETDRALGGGHTWRVRASGNHYALVVVEGRVRGAPGRPGLRSDLPRRDLLDPR